MTATSQRRGSIGSRPLKNSCDIPHQQWQTGLDKFLEGCWRSLFKYQTCVNSTSESIITFQVSQQHKFGYVMLGEVRCPCPEPLPTACPHLPAAVHQNTARNQSLALPPSPHTCGENATGWSPLSSFSIDTFTVWMACSCALRRGDCPKILRTADTDVTFPEIWHCSVNWHGVSKRFLRMAIPQGVLALSSYPLIAHDVLRATCDSIVSDRAASAQEGIHLPTHGVKHGRRRSSPKPASPQSGTQGPVVSEAGTFFCQNKSSQIMQRTYFGPSPVRQRFCFGAKIVSGW
jgi:hypothetical protein